MIKSTTDFFGGIISIYMLFIVVRIAMSWFAPNDYNERGLFPRLCDPYLNIFKKMPYFKIGYIDFSPIIALAVLVVIGSIFTQLGAAATITIGLILAIIVKALWSAVSSILLFLLVITVLRFLIGLVRPTADFPVLKSIDSFLGPVSSRVASIILKNSNYIINLFLLCIVIAACYFLGNIIIKIIIVTLIKLPF